MVPAHDPEANHMMLQKHLITSHYNKNINLEAENVFRREEKPLHFLRQYQSLQTSTASNDASKQHKDCGTAASSNDPIQLPKSNQDRLMCRISLFKSWWKWSLTLSLFPPTVSTVVCTLIIPLLCLPLPSQPVMLYSEAQQ